MSRAQRRRPMPLLQRFSAEALLPAAWRRLAPAEQCHVFNPSITMHGAAWLMAYRVVLPDQRRRIAVCRLDDEGQVQLGSPMPLSDLLTDGGDWHADPRFCSFGDRLLLHFNNGARVPKSQLDDDLAIRLQATAKSTAFAHLCALKEGTVTCNVWTVPSGKYVTSTPFACTTCATALTPSCNG